MDLSAINYADTSTLTLKHPETKEELFDDNGAPMTVTIYGAHSNEFRRAMFEMGRKRATEDDDPPSIEESDALVSNLLAQMTVDWNIQVDGEHPECSKEAAKRIYDEAPWVRQQVEGFAYRRRNFLIGASAS